MRILHVGWGFTPWRPGGLIAYAEDVMAAQLDRGDDVHYFCSGRHYPFVSGPRLKLWSRHGIQLHEVVNSPVIAGFENGTRTPLAEVSEARIDALFERTLRRVEPDLVHFQELTGLPSSLIDICAESSLPTVMTLQDYFPLCATLRLYDAAGRICTRREIGEDCVTANADAPSDPAHLVAQTLQFDARRLVGAGPLESRLSSPDLARKLAPRVRQLMTARGRAAKPVDMPDHAQYRDLAAEFQARREANVLRLGRISALVAQSARVAEIYQSLGVSGERMQTLNFTLSHIHGLTPVRRAEAPRKVAFGTLNGCASPTKGSQLVVEALRKLDRDGFGGRFRMLVFGHVHPAVADELALNPDVEIRGLYDHRQLDRLLSDVDVGLIPSVWEEAFGYVGLEMIAKGIPLIANPLGGITQYAIEGKTAWLNDPCTGAGLAETMQQLIEQPSEVLERHRSTLGLRKDLVLPMSSHIGDLDAVYRSVAGRGGS